MVTSQLAHQRISEVASAASDKDGVFHIGCRLLQHFVGVMDSKGNGCEVYRSDQPFNLPETPNGQSTPRTFRATILACQILQEMKLTATLRSNNVIGLDGSLPSTELY